MITNVSYPIIVNKYQPKRNINFKSNVQQTLTHTNIGSCMEGYIGKVRVRKGDRFEFLNVFKRFKDVLKENYTLKNDKGDLIGNIDVKINKMPPNPWTGVDESHVFVDELRNFSQKGTPYYTQGLEGYGDIGVRLMQIAQRRSDEAMCNGEIRLVSKGESLNWYKDTIGMRPEEPIFVGKLQINSSNNLYLPAENKERLSKLQGGL